MAELAPDVRLGRSMGGRQARAREAEAGQLKRNS